LRQLEQGRQAGLRPRSDGFGFKLIRKRDQPSLPVEIPMGDWKSEKIPENSFWLLVMVINLEIAYGAGRR
jgi:hypothetical protein